MRQSSSQQHLCKQKRFFLNVKERIIFFSPRVLKRKKSERERGRVGDMGLIIMEERRDVNDDSFFKLVFDKNKKELKSGQLGSNEELQKTERKAGKGMILESCDWK